MAVFEDVGGQQVAAFRTVSVLREATWSVLEQS